MKHCPFCAQPLEIVTFFCNSCARKLPRLLPDRKPSPGWRRFAVQFRDLEPELKTKAWERLDRSQRTYAAHQLGLQPPEGKAKWDGKGPFAGLAYAVLFLTGFLALANLSPDSPAAELQTSVVSGEPAPRPAAEPPPVETTQHPRTLDSEPDPAAWAELRVRARANIRSRPSMQAPVIGKVSPGELLPYLKKDGEWFVLRPSQRQGSRYIHETVVHPPAEASPAPGRQLP